MRRLGLPFFVGLLLLGCAGKSRTVPALVKALKHPKPEVRAEAALQLGRLGEKAYPALPALLEGLKDRHVSVFRASGDALVALGDGSRPGLVDMAQKASSWLKCRVIETLGRLDPSSETVPVLMEALEDHDRCVHAKAVDALARAGDPAVPSLVAELKHPNPALRRAASEALGRMPPDARERAAFPLIQQFRSSDEFARGEAELLLGELGEAAIPSLLEFLTHKDVDLRRRATVILGRVGVAEEGAVQGLVQRLNDEDRLVRLKAAMALGQIGEQDEGLLPVLFQKLNGEPSPRVRKGLVASIGNMGYAARTRVKDLIFLLKDEDQNVREEAVESLMKIGTLEAMEAVERRNRGLAK